MLLFPIQVLFMLGVPGEAARPSLQEAVRFEHERYGDIVQGNYVDSYRNLTHKAISALKYVTQNCPDVAYVLKTDDDVFVNVFSLARYLTGAWPAAGAAAVAPGRGARFPRTRTLPPRDDDSPVPATAAATADDLFLSCLVWYRMRVVRDQTSKWYVSTEDWEQEYFPPYCSGAAYILTTPTALALYNASLYTPFFWIDDLYITGVLAMRLGIKHHKFTSAYQLDFSRFYQAYHSNPESAMQLVFSHIDDFNKVSGLWNLIASRRRGVKLDDPMTRRDGTAAAAAARATASLPRGYAASFTQT